MGRRSAVLVIAGSTALLSIAAALAWRLSPEGGPGRLHDLPVPMESSGFHLLLAIGVVLGAARLGGLIAQRSRLPAVLGEITVCVLLGPSLFGALSPDGMGWLFPDEIVSAVHGPAQLGLVMFMVAAGAELDLDVLRTGRRSLLTVVYAGLAVPMAAGLALAVPTAAQYAGPVNFPVYAVFLGLVLGVTALPVLARVLGDLGLSGTPIASFALGAAAGTDLVVWSLAAICLGMAGTGAASGTTVILLTVLFVAVMVAIRPAMARIAAAMESPGSGGSRVGGQDAALPLVMVGALLASTATDAIGVHAAFGAFAFGVVLPRHSLACMGAADRLGRFAAAVLLPLFFLEVGLRTDLADALGDSGDRWWCLAFVVTAVAAKLGGVTLAVRAGRWPWVPSLTLGRLLNCRGVTELILLRIGVDTGILSADLFAILVVMTLVTSVITAPRAGVTAGSGDLRGGKSSDAAVTAESGDAGALRGAAVQRNPGVSGDVPPGSGG
ncbi:cation:proton antiporter [Spirillospora sp. NPDC048823]